MFTQVFVRSQGGRVPPSRNGVPPVQGSGTSPSKDKIPPGQVRTVHGWNTPGQGWITPSQVRMGGGVAQDRVPPIHGWATSHQGMGYASARDGVPPNRTAEGVLATRRAVCLLRSRRMTFLLYLNCLTKTQSKTISNGASVKKLKIDQKIVWRPSLFGLAPLS